MDDRRLMHTHTPPPSSAAITLLRTASSMVIQGVDAEARAAGAVVEVVAHDNLLLVQSTCKVYHTVRGAANLCLFISIIAHQARGSDALLLGGAATRVMVCVASGAGKMGYIADGRAGAGAQPLPRRLSAAALNYSKQPSRTKRHSKP